MHVKRRADESEQRMPQELDVVWNVSDSYGLGGGRIRGQSGPGQDKPCESD